MIYYASCGLKRTELDKKKSLKMNVRFFPSSKVCLLTTIAKDSKHVGNIFGATYRVAAETTI